MTEIRFLKDAPIPMRDGLNLAANIHMPAEPGKYPVIMAFTAFGKDAYWGKEFNGWGRAYEPWSPTITGTCTFEANDPDFWCNCGYIIITVDARGFNRSPGTRALAEIDGSPGEQAIIAEGRWARDEYDAIEWAGVQDWCNGSVALSGVSILGFSQWRVAGLNPPHLKCFNPWEGMINFYQDCKFPGGIPETKFTTPESWTKGSYIRTNRFEAAWPAPENEDPPAPDFMEEDDFLEKITLPALICGNWTDHGIHARGSFKGFRKISSEHKWLFTHGRYKWSEFYCSEARTMRKLFFDCYLKGMDERILSLPKVQLMVMENMTEYSVRFEDDYPVKSAVATRLYLDAADGVLKDSLPAEERSVTYDSESGLSAFDWVFEEDTELIGPSALKLWVSTAEADDMDIFVTLRKFDKNGAEVRFDSVLIPEYWIVAVGWMRLSHRELNTKASTPLEPLQKHVIGPGEKVSPGEIVPCEIPVWPAGVLFRKGESLRVEIAGRYRGGEPLPRQDKCYDDLVNKGKHTIYTGGKYDSGFLAPLNRR